MSERSFDLLAIEVTTVLKTIILAVFGFGLFFFFLNQFLFFKNCSIKGSGLTDENVLNSLADCVGTEANIQTSNYIWRKEDGTVIPLKTKSLLVTNAANISEYQSKHYFKTSEELIEKSTGFFERNGFTKSEKNTKDNEFENRIAFEKNGLMCFVVHQKNTNTVDMHYQCGVYDEENDKLSKQFTRYLNPEGDPKVLVTVNKFLEGFARGGVGNVDSPSGGVGWVAARQGEDWEIISQGNDALFDCDKITKYSIPAELLYPSESYLIEGCGL